MCFKLFVNETHKNFFSNYRYIKESLSKQRLPYDLKFSSILFVCLFVCTGSSFAVRAFASRGKWGRLSSCGAWASSCGDFSCCGAQALEPRLQSSWHMGLVALQHVESSWTRDRTRVLCIARQIPIHYTTREVASMVLSPLNRFHDSAPRSLLGDSFL